MHPGIQTKPRRQRSMFGSIVKRNRLFEVRPSFHDVARTQQRYTHETMCHQERGVRSLLLSERQDLRGNLTHYVAFERHDVRGPETIKDREQQQWIFGRLS